MADNEQEARASAQDPAGGPPTPDPSGNPEEMIEVDRETLWAMLQGARSERDQHREQAEEYRSLAQRAQADFVNYKRRTEAEQEAKADAVRAETIRAFLPIVDDIERALAHVPAEVRDEGWVQGFALIERNLASALERMGVRKIGTEGDVFDPNLHEAVAYEEHPTQPEGHVATVYRAGYQLGERVVRPAQVVVARAPQEQQGDDGWPRHQARRGHTNGGVDHGDVRKPRHIERA